MNVIIVPLDERPCNVLFPQFVARCAEDIKVHIPKESLGNKREAGNVDKILKFVEDHIQECDYAILSMDMLLYGGLLPSRIHTLDKDVLLARLQRIAKLRKINPACTIYAFQCIMRSPHYNSSEEEPDYYETYGAVIHRHAYLQDKSQRIGLLPEEEIELSKIHIPEEILQDYEDRRALNLEMNLVSLDLVEDKVFDYLVIPQDDSSEFGYTAMAQKSVLQKIKEKSLEFQTSIYPGADEVACSLLARAYQDFTHSTPKIYPMFASTLGPSIVPLYEDRPMMESLKYHVRVCGATLCSTMAEADLILAINAPGKFMQESFDQVTKLDLSYTSHRNLFTFVEQIRDMIQQGKPVALCDSAFSNGGDLQLIDFLDREALLDKLISYAGWNTNCNSLGTCLSTALLSYRKPMSQASAQHLVYRIVEDCFYQSVLRQRIIAEFLPEHHLSYYDFKDAQHLVEAKLQEELQRCYEKLSLAATYHLQIHRVYMPWKRMFEIGMDITIEKI